MIFFNLIGLAIAFVSIIIGFSVASNVDVSMFIVGVIAFSIDLLYRLYFKSEDEKIPLFLPRRGGQVMFVPVWIWGGLIFLLAVL
jgi:hypothetical protein